MMMTDNGQDTGLDALRTMIDRIDDDILVCLKKRLDIVQKVGALKQHSHMDSHLKKSYIRPGREAALLRRMLEQDIGYSPVAILSIWRQIIATAIHSEASLSIGFLEDQSSMYWLARECYGSFIPTTGFTTREALYQAIQLNQITVGIVSKKEVHTVGWLPLVERAKTACVHVFSTLPFVLNQAHSCDQAYAIACIDPEPSGHDQSLWVITMSGCDDADQVMAWLKQSMLKACLCDQQSTQLLVQVDGFWCDHDKIKERVSGCPVIVEGVSLGAYAVPYTMKS